MIVKFMIGPGAQQETYLFDLPTVPRIGESAFLPHNQSGTVRSVDWVMADDDGKVLLQPYVAVHVR